MINMRFPKVFRPDKNLKERVGTLIQEEVTHSGYDPIKVTNLLYTSQKILNVIKDKNSYIDDLYDSSEKLVNELDYSKSDLERFAEEIKLNTGEELIGFHFSVLINKIIKPDDVITLNLKYDLDGLGAFLKKGTIVVNNDLGNGTGWCMTNGKIIVNGDVKTHTGFLMLDGELHISGDIKHIAPECHGKIYNKGKLVWS